MKKFSTVKELNEMEFAQPLINSKENMMDLLVAASGNDQRVLIDIVNCLSDDQMKKCYNKLIKVYGYTGAAGQRVELKPKA
jgi:hypothetical protein